MSVMTVIRLDDKNDKIENALSFSLMDASDSGGSSRSIQILDPLASSSWEEVIKILITFFC